MKDKEKKESDELINEDKVLDNKPSDEVRKKYKKPKIEIIKLNEAVIWSAGY